jgi:hypothetical protein
MQKRRLVVLFDRATAKNFRVGNSELAPAAWVECVSGCTCMPFELGGEDNFYPSENAYGSTEVSSVVLCYVMLRYVVDCAVCSGGFATLALLLCFSLHAE